MTEDLIKATMTKMISDMIEKNSWTEEHKTEAREVAREFIEKHGSKSMFHRGELDKKLKLLKEKWKNGK
jgi:hypothetical protein